MTATLSFSLPEEAVEHQTAIDGYKWKSVVSVLDEKFRSELKYGELTTDCYKLVENMRSVLHQLLADDNLSLN